MEVLNKKQEEIVVFNKFLFFLIKYILIPVIGISLLLLEGLKRIEFKHYERLPLWEGNIIIFPNHRSWWDVVLMPHIYFPWWFREILKDLLDLIREFFITVHLVLCWIVDDRVKIKIGNGENVFSRDVPITAADKHNLRHFPWLIGLIFRVNREKYGGTVQERAASARFAQRVLKRKGRIIVFAEGGRLDSVGDGEKIFDIKTHQPVLRVLKLGFCELVSITGAKVVPVILIGTDKVILRGKFPFPRIWHKVTISIGNPLVFPVGTPAHLIESTINKARLGLYYE
ncbi:MAG: lysophospholipid acyltransferase family protein [Candidatus Nealsonbacteria bacterium]